MRSFQLLRKLGAICTCLLLAACTTVDRTAEKGAGDVVYKTTANLHTELKKGEIAVHFIDVGQGDCTLVVFPSGKRMLVDCGSLGGPFNASAVRRYISGQLDTQNPRIDLLVITHPDADHYNKLPEVLSPSDAPPIRVEKVMLVGSMSEYRVANADAWLAKFPPAARIEITDQRYNTYPAKAVPGFEQDGAVILAANVSATRSPANARSIVIKVSNRNFDAMITGDATHDTDESIMRRFATATGELDVEVWKAAHHGAWATAEPEPKSKTYLWADHVRPEAVVCSASATNTYGHPNRNLLTNYTKYTANLSVPHPLFLWDKQGLRSSDEVRSAFEREAIYLTATNGTIVVKSTGAKTDAKGAAVFDTYLERN